LSDVEVPTFSLDNGLTDGGEVVSPTRRSLFTPSKFLVLISVRGLVDPRVIVRLEDLPACSIVPQPTTLHRVTEV
jgi:hypothetical protein